MGEVEDVVEVDNEMRKRYFRGRRRERKKIH